MTASNLEVNHQEKVDTLKHYSVCICKAGSTEFMKGQSVAQKMYNKAWNTESYLSKGAYAVVIFMRKNGEWNPIANLNCALKNSNNKLPCEQIFGERNCEAAGVEDETQIAEICGLAIDDATPTEMRRAVLMMLSMGLQSIAMHTKIRWVLTVQHEFLIRILKESLGLPFMKTASEVDKKVSLPKDEYWSRNVMPRLYLLDSHHQATRAACESYFYYLSSLNITLQIRNSVGITHQSYSGFKRQWQNMKTTIAIN
ncbi:hypothetical protein PMT_1577 [Prochlorococcus marinus str. MIT 9313]|uniref:Uncharacterized protein n=1 Tax=Prochlorococcus marinus (strain MIT 9313) TaxID=74547 RepID=Q7V5I3_PROMM|nr:hypothetical protein [Prochlorococcus marinus]CAE21752.1 hypothetical protein PMT_1577 [Prochlorococcus marinus str. MIT 9313]